MINSTQPPSFTKTFLMGVLFTFAGSLAFADCASPVGYAGQLMWMSSTVNMKFCNGTSWITLNGTSTGTACTEAGKVEYRSSQIVYCNGTNWLQTAPLTNYGACAVGIAGQFYYSNTDNYYWFCNGSNWRRMGP